MCGIVGEWSQQAGAITPPDVVPRLTAMMARRGPDDAGYWSDGRRCQMGFRRLAILDLTEKGRQPMVSQDQRFVLVFNGEVYNFRELREQLQAVGVRFRSSGDAEVVLYALATWGREALDRFNGMFALALFDSAEQSLLLARDHAGIKPLYYSHTHDGVVFGSQYNQIMNHPWNREAQPSATGLRLYLQCGLIPAPHGLLKNTYAIEPGQWVQFRPGKNTNRGFYYCFPKDSQSELRGPEAIDALDQAVSRAVGRCLISDVPVGCFLSGGIDSPVVATKMHAHVGSVSAFTIGTAGDRHDEASDAKRYAGEIGHRFVMRELLPDHSVDLIEDVAAATSEPFADVSIFPTLAVSQLASEHVKVVLSGDGADELLWGYAGRYSTFLKKSGALRKSMWLRYCRWKLNQLVVGAAKFTHPNDRGYRDLPFYPGVGDWHRWKTSRLRTPWLERLFPDLPGLQTDSGQFRLTTREARQPAAWLRWSEYYAGMQTILAKVDRASMHHSLEVRVPLLDREVVDVCSRIDVEDCLDTASGIGKQPLRAVLRRSLRHQTLEKRGFRISMDHWLRKQLKPLIEDLLLTTDSILGFPFNCDAARTMFEQHVSGRVDHARHLWTLLSLRLWELNHYKSRHLHAARPAETDTSPRTVAASD